MNILCINSSEKQAELGLIKNNEKIIDVLNDGKSHSEFLLLEIENFLIKNNLNLNDIDVLSVNVGPGSFTGIRIGLSFIKAFNILNKFKTIEVNNFEIISNGIENKPSEYFVILSSNNSDFYFAKFTKFNVEYGFSNIDNFNSNINFNNLNVYCNEQSFEEFKDIKNIISVKVISINFLNVTEEKVLNNKFKETNLISPLYIKKSQAEQTLQTKINENLKILEQVNLNELQSLEQSCFNDEAYSLEQLKEDIGSITRKQFYAYLFNELIGYINFEIVLDEINLFKICVKNEFREYSVASKLFDQMINYAKLNSIKKIFLEVDEKNYPAIKLYEKFNFKKISERKNYYKNKDTAIIFSLQI